MKIQQFLEHHGVGTNPFAEEDAQTDPVFKEHCIASTYHPTWDKVRGDPAEPSTSIVFGEKGSGKTALRLQITQFVARYNRTHPNQRLFVIEYDDFNPFLDRFRDTAGRNKNIDQVLAEWKLWDHMDAILALGVTQLVDFILGVNSKQPESDQAVVTTAEGASAPGRLETALLSRSQARDLLVLAACYDQSTAEPSRQRWHRLRRKLRFRTWMSHKFLMIGLFITALVVGVIIGLKEWDWLASPWPYLMVAAGWLPWLFRTTKWHFRARAITGQTRVLNREAGPLRRVLMNFTADELSGQPMPNKQRTDDRFELLTKFQGILEVLGYSGALVLVDRVDEPHLVNGSPQQMKALLWPMLDNKFLKHPGIGFKLLLPIELAYFVEREDRDFYQRARLDKQNMIPSLEWTGEALYDVANARLKACASNGTSPSLRAIFEDSVDDRRLIDALRTLRVPRHLFKFLYRVFVAHCNAYTDEKPSWRISSSTFESALALYQRDQDAFDRGMGAG
ncbi:MAG TPA: hypothetical protein VHV55_20025 [Pirellulales bacterium]|jgi:hypothetical protein|nr:hypothetical protein [Pirellulales bacterium]